MPAGLDTSFWFVIAWTSGFTSGLIFFARWLGRRRRGVVRQWIYHRIVDYIIELGLLIMIITTIVGLAVYPWRLEQAAIAYIVTSLALIVCGVGTLFGLPAYFYIQQRKRDQSAQQRSREH